LVETTLVEREEIAIAYGILCMENDMAKLVGDVIGIIGEIALASNYELYSRSVGGF
jgi:hypothetical protein